LALGLASPQEGSEAWHEDDAVFQEASARGDEWFEGDRDEIFDLVGKKIGSCLRYFS
jgi:hypothetical protein